MHHPYFISFMLCFSIGLQAYSQQQVFTLKGVVSKKATGDRVPQVLIKNLRSHDIMMSDELGWFSVKAAIGDTLVFSKNDYTEQKIAVTGTGDIPVYMQPMVKLATVTIKGETKKQELQDVLKDYNRKGIYYNGNPPLSSILLNPLNDLHLLFGKDAADLRRFKADSKNELEYDAVRKRYNITLVKRVTNAPDSTAKKFMEYYTPSYEDMKAWNDYDLVAHIKRSYDYYDKYKDKLKLQNINAPLLIKAEEQKP